MKSLRSLTILLILMSLLAPTALAFGEGKKQFKKGIKHEQAEEWDKAAEAFALAVADNPKNPEYRLHYRRALFNASQMFMRKGKMFADEKKYAAAYVAFRKAYGYDPVNELAKSEMQRMLRLQKKEIEGDDRTDSTADVKLVRTALDGTVLPDDVVIPRRYEKLRDVPFPSGVDLEFLIRELAKDLDLNVLFDTTSFRTSKQIKIELKNVTPAQALDYIFLQEGLFFEKVGPRTILVATSSRRQFFQQLVLRTFYLANADPKDVASVIQKAIPAQPGRTPTTVLTDEDTNSITIRDTAENIRLMESLITSLDKDRAEVVMDVQIYEVSKTDLLQFGNQIGNSTSLTTLTGTTSGVVTGADNPNEEILRRIGGEAASTLLGAGILVPASNLAAFQRKDNTKLLASTQIHAFNNEDSSARIGQRVPVQTASVSSFNTNNNGQTGNNVFGTGFPVINYEQVGLTLKFKPIVFPNQDVQVTMEIESKDIVNAGSLTPTFTERTIKGTARVQNNKTLLLASVAQGVESKGREGIPLLGLIPILGRFFTAPTRDNRQVDIVIAVTPRVIRAPAILPDDVVERPTGSLAVPTSSSLASLLIREEVARQQALARVEKRRNQQSLPGTKGPEYVRASKTDGTATSENKTVKEEGKVETTVAPKEDVVAKAKVSKSATSDDTSMLPKDDDSVLSVVKPIDTNSKTIDLKRTLTPGRSTAPTENIVLNKTSNLIGAETTVAEVKTAPVAKAKLEMIAEAPEMKAGETYTLAVMVRSSTKFRSGVIGLVFDDSKVKVKSVKYGDVFGRELAKKEEDPFLNQGGKMFVSLSSEKDVGTNSSGIFAFIEIEALADGKPVIDFDPEIMNLLTADGFNFELDF